MEKACNGGSLPADAYLKRYTDEMCHELQGVLRLKQWTKSPVIIGAHAEAVVRAFIDRVVAPLLRCYTGSVVWEGRCLPEHNMPQLDVMLVGNAPLPNLFESGGFALVPRDGCHGVLEVKRSNYTEARTKIKATKEGLGGVFGPLDRLYSSPPNRFLGVICVDERSQPSNDDDDTATLIRHGPAGLESNPDGMLRLVNFLLTLRTESQRVAHRLPVQEPSGKVAQGGAQAATFHPETNRPWITH